MQRYKKYTLQMKKIMQNVSVNCVLMHAHLSCQIMNMELILQVKLWTEGMHRSADVIMYEFV